MHQHVVTGWAVTEFAIVIACAVLSVIAYRRAWAPSLRTTLLVALGLRVVIALLSRGHTPGDVGVVMHTDGLVTLRGQDPLIVLPKPSWNFLPLMLYVFAGEIKTGVDWQLACKIAPIIADLVTVVLVGYLVKGRFSPQTIRFLYAVSPAALLVTAHHGQIEPVAVAFGLGALYLAGQGKAAAGGALCGLAIAAKTWPILFLPGVLRELPVRSWWRALAGTGAVLIGLFLSAGVILGDSLHRAAKELASYRSYFGSYGWSGLLHLYGDVRAGYTGAQVDHYQRIATVLTLLTLAALLVAFRHLPGPDLTIVLMLGFLVVTGGFGGQYLMWPVALILARRLVRARVYIVLTCVYLTYWYLYWLRVQNPGAGRPMTVGIWLSVAIIVSCLMAIPWRSARIRNRPRAAPTSRRVLGGANAT
jgi:hypothetical protein